MNTDHEWRIQLDQLRRALAERPRLKSRVLQEINARDDHAPRRADFGRRPTPPGPEYLGWTAAGLSALVAAIIVSIWIMGGSGTVAFAEVQAALRKTQTAIMTHQFPDSPKLTYRILVSSDHDLFRTEMTDGAVTIQSRVGKILTLNTKLKIARITPGAGFGLKGERKAPDDLLASLQNVEMSAVKTLGKKRFGGRQLIGFELPAKDHASRHVWVDPDSRLPVREEITPLEDQPADDPSVVTFRARRSVVTYQFNVQLAGELFSLDPPEGYKLVDSDEFQWPGRKLPETPNDLDSSDYVIIPGEGIGRARFGMSKQEVVAALGEPDSTEMIGDLSDEMQKAVDEVGRKAKEENWDVFRLNREMRRLWNSKESFFRSGEALMYQALGFHVTVRDAEGLSGIMCWDKSSAYQQFAGATDRGISMKSTLAEVKRAYGEPTTTHESEEWVSIYYKELSIGFGFDGSGRMKQINVHRPDEK